MALTHVAATRNAMADACVDLIDVGGAGTLEFQTSGDVEVATITFGATAFGAASAGIATANATTDDTNATGGTIAKFRIKNGSATEIFSGTVTGISGGGDIEISSLVIVATETVSLTSLTYEAST
jgi:hypothetical protein